MRSIMRHLTILLLLVPQLSLAAGIPVVDGTAAGQRIVQLYNMGLQYFRQGEQLAREIQFVENQARQIANEVQNLQNLPKGLSMLQTVTALNGRITGILDRAESVSYELKSAEREFDRLYRDGKGFATGNLSDRQRELLHARLGAARVSVQVSSIRDNLTDTFTRLSALITGSDGVRGNKDAQQLAHQQRSLEIQNQQALAAQMAANNHLAAQMAAEDAVFKQMMLDYIDAATAPLPDRGPYQAGGALPNYRWTE